MNKPCARITLDLQQASTPTFVAVKKSDIGREIRITLSDGGFSYEISADCYAVLTGTKPDGNILYNHCDIEGNTIVYTVTEQTTAAAGRMKAEVKLYGADDQLVTSATFRIIIDGTVYTDSQVESSSEFSALTQLISQVVEIIQKYSDVTTVTKTSELINDSGFITNAVSDLVNYYTKTDIGNLLSNIPKFRIAAVSVLPTEDISETTIYLLSGGDGSDLYTEYLRVDGKWEILGSQRVDLTGYATEEWVEQKLEGHSGGNVDLTGYATEQWVQNQKYLTAVPDGYAKTTDIPTKPEDIGALPNTYTPPNQTAEQVGADPKGAAASAVSQHNTADDSHNDIRLELKVINERLTAFFDSDEQTLDELSEIVAYITSNKSLIDGITINKVSVADIINDLTTNVSTKPLSAAQGVVLSGLIDTLSKKLENYQPKGDYALRNEIPTVPTKVSAFENDKGYLTQHQDISGKVNKNGLTLGIYTDGLVYVFVDDVPVGNGIEMGASGDVFGYVDENNNIVVQGNLPDGSYTVKYEMADGSTVDIGALVLDTNVYYTVANNLTNCTSDNSATQAIGGESYSATITANDGYELSSVIVTMGGNPVTVTGGKISIAEVTGDIVIAAVAEESKAAEPVTVDIALTDSVRVGSDGTDRTQAGYCATPHIDLTNIPKPCTINLTGARWAYPNTNDVGAIMCYAKKADGTKLFGGPTNTAVGGTYATVTLVDGDIENVIVTVNSDDVASVRFSADWGTTSTTNTFDGDDAKATLTYTPVS